MGPREARLNDRLRGVSQDEGRGCGRRGLYGSRRVRRTLLTMRVGRRWNNTPTFSSSVNRS